MQSGESLPTKDAIGQPYLTSRREQVLKRALSIRQPLSELILTGVKTQEFRQMRTHIRGRVYLYAGKKLAEVEDFPGDEAAVPGEVFKLKRAIELVGTRGVRRTGQNWIVG